MLAAKQKRRPRPMPMPKYRVTTTFDLGANPMNHPPKLSAPVPDAPYWLVDVAGKPRGETRHRSLESARDEALRLAKKECQQATILQAVAVVALHPDAPFHVYKLEEAEPLWPDEASTTLGPEETLVEESSNKSCYPISRRFYFAGSDVDKVVLTNKQALEFLRAERIKQEADYQRLAYYDDLIAKLQLLEPHSAHRAEEA
jgi:hypothetical protein